MVYCSSSLVKYWNSECCGRGGTDLGVLLQQLGEVLEQGVLRPQEVELVVALLAIHHGREELASVPGHKLSRQLHNVTAGGKRVRRVRTGAELRRPAIWFRVSEIYREARPRIV